MKEMRAGLLTPAFADASTFEEWVFNRGPSAQGLWLKLARIDGCGNSPAGDVEADSSNSSRKLWCWV